MTNGEKIRSMMDKELAQVIMCPYDTAGEIMPCLEKHVYTVDAAYCNRCIVEWLQKEVPDEKPEPAWKKAVMRTFLGRNGGY